MLFLLLIVFPLVCRGSILQTSMALSLLMDTFCACLAMGSPEAVDIRETVALALVEAKAQLWEESMGGRRRGLSAGLYEEKQGFSVELDREYLWAVERALEELLNPAKISCV